MHYLRNQKNYKILETQEKVNRLIDKKLEYKIIKNAIIVPHIGCFDSNKNFIDGTWLHETTSFEFDNKYIENSIHIKKAVYIGCFAGIWGHCITDNIKRFWFLSSKFFKDYSTEPILYTMVNNIPLPNNFHKISEILVPNNVELKEIQETFIVDELIIPDVSIYSSQNDGKLFYKEFLECLNKIENNYLKPNFTKTFEKIYLSRTKLKSHLEYGEIIIEKIFKQVGFEIIYPETLSFEQQIHLFQNCKYFASLEGSGAHNSIFCKPETKVFILRKSDSINPYQILIDKISNTKTSYIDSNLSIMNSKKKPWTGPFFVYQTKSLINVFKDEFNIVLNSHFPIFEFIKYIIDGLFYHFLNFLRFIHHLFWRK
ncbi:MAG: glycosyltransferase family 61 protein [Treponema sp.]|nr:glycosyltransferase family 61 protein [Treponema sp.]